MKIPLKIKKNKILILIILAISVRLLLSFVVYGPQPSQLAPDENTFAELNKWILLGGRAADFPLAGGDLFFTSLSFNIPTIGFIFLGVSPIMAIRVTSNLYSLLSILLIYRLFNDIKGDNKKITNNKYFEVFMYILFLIYLFLPSHLIWATLGIRESTNEFWLILTFYICYQILRHRKDRINYIYLFFSVILLYFSRPQVGYLAILVITFLGIVVILKKKEYLFLFSSLGSWLVIILLQIPINKSLEPSNSSAHVASLQTFSQVFIKQVNKPIDEFKDLSNLQASKASSANTAVEVILCPDYFLTNIPIICKFHQIPTRSINYISRPIFFVDQLDSTLKKFVALENLFWILISIYTFVLVIIYRNSMKNNFYFKILLMSFILFFIILSGLFEGNYGTAYRHKSLLLPIILILALVMRIDSAQQRGTINMQKTKQ
jgi:hypothetical protein